MKKNPYKKANLERIEEDISVKIGDKEPRPTGRPKLNPYAEDIKLTARIPMEVHRRLRILSADKGKPMVQVLVDILDEHLSPYEDI